MAPRSRYVVGSTRGDFFGVLKLLCTLVTPDRNVCGLTVTQVLWRGVSLSSSTRGRHTRAISCSSARLPINLGEWWRLRGMNFIMQPRAVLSAPYLGPQCWPLSSSVCLPLTFQDGGRQFIVRQERVVGC